MSNLRLVIYHFLFFHLFIRSFVFSKCFVLIKVVLDPDQSHAEVTKISSNIIIIQAQRNTIQTPVLGLESVV